MGININNQIVSDDEGDLLPRLVTESMGNAVYVSHSRPFWVENLTEPRKCD